MPLSFTHSIGFLRCRKLTVFEGSSCVVHVFLLGAVDEVLGCPKALVAAAS